MGQKYFSDENHWVNASSVPSVLVLSVSKV